MIVTVVGTGYVGLVTGACLAAKGHQVRCVDVSLERVRAIQSGAAPFYEPRLDDLLRSAQAAGNFLCTTDLEAAMRGSEISLIAVGTPDKAGDPDLSYVETAARQIATLLSSTGGYHVVCVKSTVVPGTTRNLVGPALEKHSGFRPGKFGLCMNPEFLREGTAVDDFQHPDRIVIGESDPQAGDVLARLYDCFPCEKPRVSLEEAELTKYASNTLLSVLISYSNEIAGLCEATPGADVETVMRCLQLDRRLSPFAGETRIQPEILSYLRAGIGFGGSCLPKDVNALRGYGRKTGVPLPLLDAVVDTNRQRPLAVVRMAETALGTLKGKRVALLGLAFKAGTDDLRSSPGVALLHRLRESGAEVQAYDPLVSPAAAEKAGLPTVCTDSLDDVIAGSDAALITTTDPLFRNADWPRLARSMRTPVVIDGRNVLRGVTLPDSLRYYPIGKGGEYAGAARLAL
jgi:UDPglucose 6-dehydrogenase